MVAKAFLVVAKVFWCARVLLDGFLLYIMWNIFCKGTKNHCGCFVVSRT